MEGLDALAARCAENGSPISYDEPLAGYRRLHVADPFGNRIELMEVRDSQVENRKYTQR